MKIIILTLFLLLSFSCSEESKNINTDDNIEYNQEGELLECIIGIDLVKTYELFIYDNENRPIFRLLEIDSHFENYDEYFNNPIFANTIHKYEYDVNNKVIQTKLFSGEFKFENNRIYSTINNQETDITDLSFSNGIYFYIDFYIHEYENNMLKKIIIKNYFGIENYINDFVFDNDGNLTRLVREDLHNNDGLIENYEYVDNKIHTRLNNGNLSQSFQYHNYYNSPYFKLLKEFGIIVLYPSINSYSVAPFGKNFKYFVEKYYFVSGTSSYYNEVNEVNSYNSFNYPKETIDKWVGQTFEPRHRISYIYR